MITQKINQSLLPNKSIVRTAVRITLIYMCFCMVYSNTSYQSIERDFKSLKFQSTFDILQFYDIHHTYLLSQKLVTTIGQVSLQQESNAYTQNYGEFLNILNKEFNKKSWKGDPDLNCNIVLDSRALSSNSQSLDSQQQTQNSANFNNISSILFKGGELVQLALQVSVAEIQTLNTDHEGIFVLLINLSELNDQIEKLTTEQQQKQIKAQQSQTKESSGIGQLILQNSLKESLQYMINVRKHHFKLIKDLNSDIYEVLFIDRAANLRQFTKEKAAQDTESGNNKNIIKNDGQKADDENNKIILTQTSTIKQKHISLQLEIDNFLTVPRTPPLQAKISLKQQHQMILSMKEVTHMSDQTFLESLELFDKIDQHRKRHQKTLQQTGYVAFYEIIGLAVLYTIEYLFLRYLIGKKNII